MPERTGRNLALILSGGGARAAYQVGVLKAIAEITPSGIPNPFPILCGTSAGSINAAALAASASDFRQGVARLLEVWKNFDVGQVFHADVWSAVSRGGRVILTMMTGGVGDPSPRSLLDNTPLRELIADRIPLDLIGDAVGSGVLQALCVTACSYSSGCSVSYFHGAGNLEPWSRSRRLGLRADIGIDHLMASASIPIVFPAVAIGNEYFGDGIMRQTSPLSPALHLGADRVLIIGVRQENVPSNQYLPWTAALHGYPGMGQIAGYILDTLFLNNLNADLERLQRINRILTIVPAAARGGTDLRPIETLLISPSRDIGAIAEPHLAHLPATMQYLMRVIGARKDGGKRLLSYLLFHGKFCRELIDLGFNDTMNKRQALEDFLKL
jgi:NTE family protein